MLRNNGRVYDSHRSYGEDMAKKVTISVPNEIYNEIEAWRSDFNLSRIFQSAIQKEIAKKKQFRLKMEDERTPREVFEKGDFDTPEEQFITGKEMGFSYAKNSPYHVIKPLEEYTEGWEKRDKETIERLSRDLDIASILDGLGFVEQIDELPGTVEFSGYLSTSFDLGFMEGAMEFIQKEYTLIEASKLTSERSKRLRVAKDEKERIRIFREYKSKFNGLYSDQIGKQNKKKKKKK